MRSAQILAAAMSMALSAGTFFGRDRITVAGAPGATGVGGKGAKAKKKARDKIAAASKRRNRK